MAFIAGVVLNLPGVWYLDALFQIARANPSTLSALLQLIVFNVIMFMLVEIPIVAYLVAPGQAQELVSNISDWGRDHARTIATAVATCVGAWLLAKGLVELI